MVNIGNYNTLQVLRVVDFGVYLDGGEKGDILLPLRYVPQNYKIGDEIDVFVYYDSEDRIIATTERPYALVGEFAVLKVNSVNSVGVFLDWGLASKELLVPFREQRAEMFPGKYYTVYLYLDEVSGRIVATAKLNRYLQRKPVDYTFNQEVDILVTQESAHHSKALKGRSGISLLHIHSLKSSEKFLPERNFRDEENLKSS